MQTPEPLHNLPHTSSLAWFERAAAVIPGGVYGHTSPVASLPLCFPYYAERAEGCYFFDVDGNRYLDFLCAYGPIILGHQHPEIEATASRMREAGGLFSHPSTVMVELAELLVQRVDFADWAVFAKNGSDVTTWALQVARQSTGRKKVLVVKGAYHGVDAWTNPSPGGVIEEDRMHIHPFPWNDEAAFEALLQSHQGEVAAIITTPYHHPSFGLNVLPTPSFVSAVNRLSTEHGVVLILDDIRAGFRLHAGGSHRVFGWEPDMACYCKALGNGYPVSAAVGKSTLKAAAGKVFLTGSYWNDAIALAAAKCCLEIIERDDVPAQLQRTGQRLLDGLVRAAAKHGFELIASGPAAAPMVGFAQDASLRLLQRFAELCASRGVLFHPHHNWFVSLAHDDAAIDHAIAIADQAFRELTAASQA
jgi:glutamate-1-semialdehyde 2,1-aminomutase